MLSPTHAIMLDLRCFAPRQVLCTLKYVNKTQNQILGLLLIALTVSILAIYIFNSPGFCYERHNGLYCYKGENLNLVGIALLFTSSAVLVHLAELKARRTIKILNNSYR